MHTPRRTAGPPCASSAEHKYGSIHARLTPPLTAAWRVWHTALDGIRALGDADEAYEALLGNYDRARAVTIALALALANGTLLGDAADEAREWLYQTCAKAHRLHTMEHNRKRLAASVTAQENLTLPTGDPTAIDKALTTSEVLAANAPE